jgi:hypothetical protein
VIPVQLLLIAVAMVGFNQEWQVEEERPVGGAPLPGEDGETDEARYAESDEPRYAESDEPRYAESDEPRPDEEDRRT